MKFYGNDTRVANKDAVTKTHFLLANYNPTVMVINIFQKLRQSTFSLYKF